MRSTRRITLPKHKKAKQAAREEKRKAEEAKKKQLDNRRADMALLHSFNVKLMPKDGRPYHYDRSNRNGMEYSASNLEFFNRPQLLRIAYEEGLSPVLCDKYPDGTIRSLIARAIRARHTKFANNFAENSDEALRGLFNDDTL